MTNKIKTFFALSLFSFLTLSLGLASSSQADTYKVNPQKSKVEFRVKHFGQGTVVGRFKKYEGSFSLDRKEDKANISSFQSNGTINVISIDTGIKARDNHLRSKEIFDIKQFPSITFETTGIQEMTPGKQYKVLGNLTIKGITKQIPILLTVKKSPKVNEFAFTANTHIQRKDFNVVWSSLVEATGSVGQDLNIVLDITGEKI